MGLPVEYREIKCVYISKLGMISVERDGNYAQRTGSDERESDKVTEFELKYWLGILKCFVMAAISNKIVMEGLQNTT
jgi:hypothetical protein